MLTVCFFGCLVVFSNFVRKWQSKSSENPVTSWLAVSSPLHLLEVVWLQTYSCFCFINRYTLNTLFAILKVKGRKGSNFSAEWWMLYRVLFLEEGLP